MNPQALAMMIYEGLRKEVGFCDYHHQGNPRHIPGVLPVDEPWLECSERKRKCIEKVVKDALQMTKPFEMRRTISTAETVCG
jgi:hypothetical protein